MTLQAGARLGPYEVVELLGAGGMGEVYKAKDTRLKRLVAVKILSQRGALDSASHTRFEREARTIAGLNHPHICTLHDVGRHDGVDFLVMECIDGETLADRLRRGSLPLDKCLAYGAQIADGLSTAHLNGIVHGDLNPRNIMLTTSGAKILDFGLAKPCLAVASGGADGTATITDTATKAIVGTLPYMAPEQLEGKACDSRADVWALGAVLYEMVTGTRAFAGDTSARVMSAILERDVPALDAVQTAVPPLLSHVVAECLTRDVTARWRSAHDVAAVLRWVRDSQSEASPAAVRLRARNPTIAWTVAALSLLALAISLTSVLRRAPESAAVSSEMRLEVVTPPGTNPFSFAISPDGRSLVYVSTAEGRGPQLYLRPFDSLTAQALPGTGDATRPFWSPDSRSVAFFANSRLNRIDLASGTVSPVATAPPESVASSGTWGLDGTIMLSGSGVLARVPAGGGEPTYLRQPGAAAGESIPEHARFLPDSRHFVCWRPGRPGQERRGIYVGSLDSAEMRWLVDADTTAIPAPPSHVLFLRQGTLLAQTFDFATLQIRGDPVAVIPDVAYEGRFPAVSASHTGVIAFRRAGSMQGELAWFSRSGRRLDEALAATPILGSNPELSRDGRRLAFQRDVNGNTDVWLLNVPGPSVPVRLTFDAAVEGWPVWAPDSKHVVFMSQVAGGVMNLYRKAASGAAAPEPLLVTPQHKMATDWSPDGRFILYRNLDPTAGRDLRVLPLTGNRKPFAYVSAPAEEREGVFSPDGRWVAFQSNESRRFEVYVQSFPDPHSKWQVSTDGGTQPRWRRDGRELFFVGADGKLMATPIAGSSTQQSIETAAPTPLFHPHIAGGAQPGILKHQYDAAADGQRFVISTETSDVRSVPITVLLNWRPVPEPRARTKFENRP